MTDIQRMMHVQAGVASSATDLTTVPTMSSIEVIEASVHPRDTMRLDRDLMRGDNMRHASLIGPKNLDEINLSMLMRGVSTNDGGALDPEDDTELGELFTSIFGVAGIAQSGAATTISGDTGASSILALTSGTNHLAGGGELFMDGNGDYIAREIVSVNSNDLTLDRTWTDGAPGSDAVPYRSVYWTLPAGTVQHLPTWIRGISTNWERTYAACTCTGCTIEVPEGGPVRVNTRWAPNDWSDTAVAPSFSAQTAGDYVVGLNSALYVGNSKLLVRNASLDLGLTAVPRTTINGTNGIHGHLVTRKEPVLNATIYFGGSGLTFGEVVDTGGGATDFDLNKIVGLENAAGTTLQKGQASATYDVALQVGAGPGRTMYVRIPAAEIRGRMEVDNGIEVVRLQIIATRPSAGTMLRLHCF
jgi:hypothetical protein